MKRRQTPDRPRDVSQLAKRIVDISTGEESDEAPEAPDEGRSKGGKARASKLTPEERKRIAKRAADARWGQE